jgi:hypothetical protein
MATAGEGIEPGGVGVAEEVTPEGEVNGGGALGTEAVGGEAAEVVAAVAAGAIVGDGRRGGGVEGQ